MEEVEAEINECLKRKNLLERRLTNNLTVESIQLNAALLETRIRLRLLQKHKSLNDVDQSGCGSRKRAALSNNEPDATIMRTVNEIAWLKDVQNLKQHGETIDEEFEGKPLSHFLKFSNPVEKGSSSRGTIVFETGAIITNVEEAHDPENLIIKVFGYILEVAFSSKSRPPDKLNVQFFGEGMGSTFYIPMRSPEQNNVHAIAAQFQSLSTSETLTSIFNNQLAVKVCGYWAPGGANCKHSDCKHVVSCENKSNNFCLARALCYGKKWIEKKGINLDAYKINGLERDTLALMKQSGLDLLKDFYTLSDAQIFMDILGPEYRIVVYNDRNQIIMNTKYAENVRKICLQCLKAVQPHHHYRGCEKLCYGCMRAKFNPCKSDGDPIKCPDCFYTFVSRECFDFHKATTKIKKNSLCSQRKVCQICQRIVYTRDKRHKCGKEDGVDNVCDNCDIVHTDEAPFCYINPKKPKPPQLIRYIYFDTECQIVNGKHIPILLCSYVYCTVCQDADIDIDSPLSGAPKNCRCGRNTYRYKSFNGYDGSSPVDKFIDYVITLSLNKDKPAKSVVYAHNLSKYDGHLLLEKLYAGNYDLDVVSQGFKLYSFDLKLTGHTIVFKDSLNFFAAPLKALPKMFNFEQEASKQYFAHGYNLPENLHVSLSTLPPAKDFWPDNMKPDEREKFYAWYEENKNTPFTLSTDMEGYCKTDTIILLKSCVKFRSIMMSVNGIDPFATSSTIASYAYLVFRTNVLKEKMLVNVPDGGYRKNEKQSEEALKFFRVYEYENNVTIEDASNKGEFKVPNSNYKVDGVIRDANGKIKLCLEYNSCFYHGHTCYRRNQPLAGGIPAKLLYEATMKRFDFIEKQFKIVMFWQCEVKEKLKRNKLLKSVYDNVKLAPRIQLRETALKGGRVEVFRIFYKCKPGEEIRFIDIVSLYPWVMKHCSFPLGHPKVITWESFKGQVWTNPNDNSYKGFILCKVLPPNNIECALLPYKSENGNLVFCFCKSCSDAETRDCSHTVEERSWTATFTHVELNEALAIGYKVLQIFEVWDFPEWSTPGGGSKDLFGKYVDTFLSLKIMASGWPSEDEEERKAFVQSYIDKEGIHLNPNKMEYNSGKRAVAKLMRGKLAQRTNLSEIRITNTAEDFHIVMNDNTLDVLDFTHINDSTDRIVVKKKEEFQTTGKNTCLQVACFVTSHARIKLFSYLKQVPGRKIYCDTDSLCYIVKPGLNLILEGNFLGDMSREYADRIIIEFCAAGPKNYAILLVDKNGVFSAILKIRGFPLNFSSSQLITYETFKEKVLQKFKELVEPAPIDVPYTTIRRNKFGHLNSVAITKRWQPVLKKGFVQNDFSVKPWGYKK